ncbi:MAG: hypothetical protein QM660_07400 [Dysgonomonas sp.]
MIIRKICILLLPFLFVFVLQNSAQEHDSIYRQKSFINFGLFGGLCTNGKKTIETTNNISLSLLHGSNRNVYGFAFAPFNYIESSMYGLQIGFNNAAFEEVRGIQIGFGNGTKNLKGTQIGGFNLTEESHGIQLGFLNIQKSGGLQIGMINISHHNNYPIGFINIIKDGNMNAGMTIDEMSLVTTNFRSGGRYLYGIAGIGYSFASSLNHVVLEGGIGTHLHISDKFRIDTEISATHISKVYSYMGSSEEAKETARNYDYKTASRFSLRLVPSARFGNHIEVSGGPTLNYLQSQCMDNKKIFPSHYMWRKFTKTSLRQVHWGWITGVQYKF